MTLKNGQMGIHKYIESPERMWGLFEEYKETVVKMIVMVIIRVKIVYIGVLMRLVSRGWFGCYKPIN